MSGRGRLRFLVCAVLAAVLPDVTAATVQLTPEEQAWIAENPVVRIAADPQWSPLEYIDHGRHGGLVAGYLEAIEHRTGLRFEVVPDSGWGHVTTGLERAEVDVLPATLHTFTSPAVAHQIEFTRPYFVGSTVVITGEATTAIHDLAQLDGKVLAFKRGGAYESFLRALHPRIVLSPVDTTEQALVEVMEGRAVAALDSNVTVLPLLRRKYAGQLHQAGVIRSVPMALAMGVHRDKPILLGILDKTLASLTSRETDVLIERHFRQADYGAPSWPSLSHHYRSQLYLFTAGLFLIIGFAVHAHRQHQRARRSEKEKSTFLAVMSHEIRSPMNAIMGAMEILARADLPTETQRLVRVAANGGNTLLHLLDDVLDVSKLEAGRLVLEKVPVDLMEVVHSVTDLLSVSAEAKGITLGVEVGTLPEERLLLDRMRIGQILHNLIGNAIKFTPHGGVTVRIDYEPATASGAGDGMLELRIIDTGIGMDDASQGKLFGAYTQARTSTARQFGGTGLGLWICRALAAHMGGRISLESALGKGTAVTVRLPATRSTDLRAVDKAVNAFTRIEGRTPRVLLTEDTEANQIVLMAQLALLGCDGTLARDGTSALRRLAEDRYDLILMDCDLPDMSGFEVVRTWRAEEADRALAPTPVLAISACSGPDHTRRCFEAGMDGVLTKPISLGKLQDALLLWCDLAPAAPEAVIAPDLRDNREQIVEAMRKDIAGIVEAGARGDNPDGLHHAHRLVGAGEVLGMTALVTAARAMEQRFRTAGQGAIAVSAVERERLEALLQAWSDAAGR